MNKSITDQYFDWMYDLACGDLYPDEISYRKLFEHLHKTEFISLIKRDENRADDGERLRYRFASANDMDNYDIRFIDNRPSSVLEMIIALAIRCEETIMDNALYGDRTRQWFWRMIRNLGLGTMTDDKYDEKYVSEVLDRFLSRDYEPNGRGGLFVLRRCKQDLRNVEIWYQLNWYLNEVLGNA